MKKSYGKLADATPRAHTKPEKFGSLPKVMQSHQPFVGLKNLGNICYLKSVMQQFYHIPEVCKGILAAQVPQKRVWMKERALRT